MLAERSLSRRALLLAPVAWVAVELARTRITGFPWDLLGTTQVDNVPLARLATFTGVYGLSFEIMIVNVAFATAFLVRREKRQLLLVAAFAAAAVLQCGQFIPSPVVPTDHAALLLQPNLPILEAFRVDQKFLRRHTWRSFLNQCQTSAWPSSGLHRVAGIASAVLCKRSILPQCHQYCRAPVEHLGDCRKCGNSRRNGAGIGLAILQFRRTREPRWRVGFALRQNASRSVRRVRSFPPFVLLCRGTHQRSWRFFSRHTRARRSMPETEKLGIFICYESIFPDEIRQLSANGAQPFS